MSRPPLEVADIFNSDGAGWRRSHVGHISLDQLKAMSAIERCRTDVLGGHRLHCTLWETDLIAYNSCRNRHCPKCQSSAASRWLADRQAELLPVEYYHVVFTLPTQIADLAYQNKAVIYDLLFKASAKTLSTIAADPKHLGAKIGFTSVLHTWGSALTHHPHVHCIVPGGGLAAGGKRWKPCKQGFFLPVRVLSRLFRRLFLDALNQAHRDRRLQFFGKYQPLIDRAQFATYLEPTTKIDWVVYAKRPFAGPDAVLTYLSRYTHRIAISNRRLVSHTKLGVTFRWKDYRVKRGDRFKTMTLTTKEFIRRFLMHVLPSGFHRIRHYGLFASHVRRSNLERIRKCLKIHQEEPAASAAGDSAESSCAFICRSCGAPLIIVETLNPKPRAPPT